MTAMRLAGGLLMLLLMTAAAAYGATALSASWAARVEAVAGEGLEPADEREKSAPTPAAAAEVLDLEQETPILPPPAKVEES